MQPSSAPPSSSSPGRPEYAPPPPAGVIARARPWLTALIATLTLLVLIAAVGNQKVTETIERHAFDNTDDFGNRYWISLLTYQWRFSPQGSKDFGHFWLASIVFDVTALVLTLLLVAALVRGRGFGQIFLATWAAVVVATMLSGYVRGAIVDEKKFLGSRNSKAYDILFGSYAPSASAFLAALTLGLLVAIVAGIAGVLTRRRDALMPPAYAGPYDAPVRGPYPPEASTNREPWTPPPATPVPGPVAAPSPWNEPAGAATTSLEKRDQADAGGAQNTAVLPTVPDEPSDDEAATTQLPRTDPEDGHPNSEPGP